MPENALEHANASENATIGTAPLPPEKRKGGMREKIRATYRQVTVQAHPRFPLARIIVLFSLVIMLLNCAVVIKRGIDDYRSSIIQGKDDVGQLTRTLAQHVELTFLSVDLTLRRAVERQYFNALFGNNLLDDMRHNLTLWANESPQIAAILMTDGKGAVTVIHRKKGYEHWMEGVERVASRAYFSAHAETADPESLYVGWQESGVDNHDGFVVMSRRINDLDGAFGGIILAAVDSEYVHRFFRSVENGEHTRLVLLRQDGRLLIGRPETADEGALLDRTLKEQHIFSAIGEEIPAVVDEDGFDGRMRLFAFSRMPNLQMVLAVISYGENILYTWREQRINDLVFLGIFGLFVLVISFFAIAMARQMQRVQRSEQAAVMASQAKSEFLANMSHELRTPLNAIIGFSEMLEAGYFGTVNAKQRERIHDINGCGAHLLELINDILEFSKGEAGKIELRESRMALPQLVRETVRIFAERAKKEGITVTSGARDMPLILADERKIKQILMNLLSNAVKFTEKNGMIEAACGIDRSGNVFLTVTDTGIGMAEADIPKALSAFGQVHNDPARGGTGLGLPLCKMFAELHGGSLRVQSIEGVGTKVTVILPAARILSDAAAKVHSLPVDGGDRKKKSPREPSAPGRAHK